MCSSDLTTYLDISHQLQMLEHVTMLSQQGKTVVMVVHDISAAMKVADRLVLMEEGRVAFCGTPEEVYQSGEIDRVFSVKLNRVSTPKGWHYYCEEA